MKSMNNIKKVLFVLFFSFIFTACGYKPLYHYAKKEINGKIFVNLFIDLKDPQNGVIIKDTMNKLLIQKLKSKLVYDEALANTIMNLKINSVDMNELQYDKSGYIKLYRTIVNIKVNYFNKETKKRNSFLVDGEYNFSIDDGTSITDSKRFEAIKKASNNALDEVLSKLAVLSFQK